MSKEKIHQFISAVNQSPKLREQAQKALEGSKDPAGFVAVAKGAGYEFSTQDAATYFREVLSPQRPGKLTDKELDQVGVSAGSKDSPAGTSQALGDTVKMFKQMSFNSYPSWTGFNF